jgi:hypothetical protein
MALENSCQKNVLRVSENKEPKRICECKKGKLTGYWRRFLKMRAEFYDL